MRALAHQGLGFLWIVPEIGGFGERVQLVETGESFLEVKDASSANPAIFRWLLRSV